MRCFSLQKASKKYNGAEQEGSLEGYGGAETDEDSSPSIASRCSSLRMSFRGRVSAIQNAQKFINSNPKLRSSHPSYGSKESRKDIPDVSSPLLPLDGPARPATDPSSDLFDVGTADYDGRRLESTLISSRPLAPPAHHPRLVDDTCTDAPFPQPLPSPTQASQALQKITQPWSAHRLPLPSDNAHNASYHPGLPQLNREPNSLETNFTRAAIPLPLSLKHSNLSLKAQSLSSTVVCKDMQNSSCLQTGRLQSATDVVTSSIQGVAINGDCLTSEMQSFLFSHVPALKTLPLRRFQYDELASACQNFSPDHCIEDAHICFYGTLKVKGSWMPAKHEDVVVLILKEPQQQGLEEWISRLSMVAHDLQHQASYVCKLVGFYGEERCAERMLVYERLKKGTLSSLLFGTMNVPPLDWLARMRIAYGTAQGLAKLHEKFPKNVLYTDFGASNIQVDHDHSAKVSHYRFVNPRHMPNQRYSNNQRVIDCRAPETVNQGELTLKSNVWSFGVVLLELLSGKQYRDEVTVRNKRQDLVKWAKPFLSSEGKLFLLMDPKLQGKFPARGAKLVADLALVCLKRDPTKRPTMRVAVDVLSSVQDSSSATQSTRLKEASSFCLAPLPVLGYPSVASTLQNQQTSMMPSKFDVVESPPLKPLMLPPRCRGEGNASHHTSTPLCL